MSKRAQRTDSINEQVKAAQNADKVHDWPPEAGSCSLESWDIYVKNQTYRAHDDWLPGDLVELARMSRMQVAAIDLQEMLDDQGYVVLGGKNGDTRVENPAMRAIGTVNANINAVRRILGMTAGNEGNKQTRANKRDLEREASVKNAMKEKENAEFSGQSLM